MNELASDLVALREQCIEAAITAYWDDYEIYDPNRGEGPKDEHAMGAAVDAILPLVRTSMPQYERIGYMREVGDKVRFVGYKSQSLDIDIEHKDSVPVFREVRQG